MTTDIHIDEKASLSVRVNTTYPDGTPRDITNTDVVWVASFNDVQVIKKDVGQMTIALAPSSTTLLTAVANAGQPYVTVAKVSGFSPPADEYQQNKPNLLPGTRVYLTNSTGLMEQGVISSINGLTIQLTQNLVNQFTTAADSALTTEINYFSFSLLPGDTMLSDIKTYGTPTVYQHMAWVYYPGKMTPGNIYAQPNTYVALRGKLYILPVLDSDYELV